MNANTEFEFTNALIHERSPYLLQHAHNPVQWNAWSEKVFEIAQSQNKPILLSIGYAACHWCHVMERESFEDKQVAAFMNAHFINVKVDREERPDVDQIYMDALQAMTGSGGWPLNIFLLPDGKPFYGGTYFPPVAMQQRASWMDVLKGVYEAYISNKEKLIEQAVQLTSHIVQTNISEIATDDDSNNEAVATKDEFALMAQRILQQADTQWGGFGNAPKFPQTFALQLLLRNYHLHQHDASLIHAIRSIDKMIQGGIYDHLGGGFARYSTDVQWQAPHFEKMLYDNALLVTLMSEAYQITQKPLYKTIIQETIHFLNRELTNEGGAFYAALDADSEGVEGKYYTWSHEEIKSIVDPTIVDAFCNYYQISEEGNWEHSNIIWTKDAVEDGWSEEFIKAKQQLFAHRLSRIKPALDYKIILSWNNLMIIGLCKAFAAIGDVSYKARVVRTMEWLEKNMLNKDAQFFYHTHTEGMNKSLAFLEDYATLIQAYIQLQEITGDASYLLKAKHWTEFVQAHFVDEQGVYFYFTPDQQQDIILRKKDNYDGAQASGNAVMCSNLYYLSHVFDRQDWLQQSRAMMSSMRKRMLQYPSSFSYWAQTFYQMSVGFTELIAVGPGVHEQLSKAKAPFLPQMLSVFLLTEMEIMPITLGKQGADNQYFICKNNTCSAPLSDLDNFLAFI